MSTSQYSVAKEQGNTFVYQPTNSPNIFSTASETSPKPNMANEKVIRTEKVIEEKIFPDNSSSTFIQETKTTIPTETTSGNNFGSTAAPLSNNIPTAPPPPPVKKQRFWQKGKTAPPAENGTFADQLQNKKGTLNKTTTKEPSFIDKVKHKVMPEKSTTGTTGTTGKTGSSNAPLKPTSTSTTGSNLNNGTNTGKTTGTSNTNLNNGTNAGKTTSTSTTGSNLNNGKTSGTDHYVEPHKPSQVKHVKGIIKEKVGHLTKNHKMEENGRILEAEFEKEKFDYNAYQHNAGK